MLLGVCLNLALAVFVHLGRKKKASSDDMLKLNYLNTRSSIKEYVNEKYQGRAILFLTLRNTILGLFLLFLLIEAVIVLNKGL